MKLKLFVKLLKIISNMPHSFTQITKKRQKTAIQGKQKLQGKIPGVTIFVTIFVSAQNSARLEVGLGIN